MALERVAELMTKDVIRTVGPKSSVAEVARRMKEFQCGCMVVVDEARPVGIVTERDLVQKVVAENLDSGKVKVSQIMSTGLITVGQEALVSDAAKVMLKNRIRRLVVTEGTRVVGIITTTDFAKFLFEKSRADPMLAAMARAASFLSP